jgi:hypothetical protein
MVILTALSTEATMSAPDLSAVFEIVRAWAGAYLPDHGDIILRIERPGHWAAILPVATSTATGANPQAPSGHNPLPRQPSHFRHSGDFRNVQWFGRPEHLQ